MSQRVYERILKDSKVESITPYNISHVREIASKYVPSRLRQELNVGSYIVSAALNWIKRYPPEDFQIMLKTIFDASPRFILVNGLLWIYPGHSRYRSRIDPYILWRAGAVEVRGKNIIREVKGNEDVMKSYWPDIENFPIQNHFNQEFHRVNRVEQAIMVLKKDGPITEKSIKNLSVIDFKLAGIDVRGDCVRSARKRLLRKLKEGKLHSN
jgi:hypothetical protein